MAQPFQNVYIHRKVAESSSKPCMICFKPSTSVLITSCQKVDEAAEAERKKKEEMDKELEKIKKEYEEKLKRKEEKKQDKGKGKEKSTKDEDTEKVKIEAENAASASAKAAEAAAAPIASFSQYQLHRKGRSGEAAPALVSFLPLPQDTRSRLTDVVVVRTFLGRSSDFFNMRQQKYRDKQLAKRNMERLKNPLSFPAVPKGDPI
ncbi:hypothetical protein Dda_8074 [Drechslerella dactyloides]|uniref:Uncharacterized protein n=1 Tax=Drechslerella dactyloides TaxID=74499 RepID=A0AAD6IRM5_DREDA|nr:hypothetical protein Dda_8074 [Drechslerella dactyloides]